MNAHTAVVISKIVRPINTIPVRRVLTAEELSRPLGGAALPAPLPQAA